MSVPSVSAVLLFAVLLFGNRVLPLPFPDSAMRVPTRRLAHRATAAAAPHTFIYIYIYIYTYTYIYIYIYTHLGLKSWPDEDGTRCPGLPQWLARANI